MYTPQFSVIIPVYNTKKYICECVDSVLSQSVDDFEILLIDDGSSDGSGDLCDELSQKDSRIRAYHKNNQGQLHSRIFGINKSKGKYCLYLDSDDYLENDALQYLSEIILENKCDCIIFGLQSVSNGKILATFKTEYDIFCKDKREIYKICFSGTEYNSVCRKAFRRDIWNDKVDMSRFFYLRHGEDLLQSIEILKNCKNVYFSSKVLYNYRMNPNSVTHTSVANPQIVDFLVSETALGFLKNEAEFNVHDFDEYRKTRLDEFFLPSIKRIITSNITFEEKKEAFIRIRQSRYYKDFLGKRIIHSCDGPIYYCFFLLFKYKFDTLLIILLQVMHKTKFKLDKRKMI